MATKLKKMALTSVDLVRAGANQEADICLYKSADATEQPAERETNIIKRFLNWLRENPTEAENEAETPVEKDFSTFDELNARRECDDKLWRYNDALSCSIRSIQEDKDLSSDQKLQMMTKSFEEYAEAMKSLFSVLSQININPPEVVAAKSAPEQETPEEVEKAADIDEIEEVGKSNIDHIEEVQKFNPYHGKDGRFTSANSAASFSYSPRQE